MNMGDVLNALERKASAQWGLVTTAQAKQRGVQGVQLLRLERAGSLSSVGHGVYLLADVPVPEHLRTKVAWLRLDPSGEPARRRSDCGSGVVSHGSACELLGLGDLPPGPVELTLPVRRTTRDEGVRLHRLPIEAADVTVLDGLPVTTAARTVADLLRAGVGADRIGRVLADAVDKGLVGIESLAAHVLPYLPRYGLRESESGEQLLHSLCERSSRPRPAGGPRHARKKKTGAEQKRATIQEVARLAGVSHQTVSRYLRNDAGMKPLTREQVARAITALNYRPSAAARSMRTQRSNRVAIVLPELTEFAPLPMLKGAAAAAHEAGFTTDVIGLEGGPPRRAESVFALLDSRQADGILCLAPLPGLSEAPRSLAQRIVVLGEYDDRLHARGETAGGRPVEQILKFLAGLGHRRFLHVAGPQEWTSARNRRAVYAQAIARLGLESHGIVDGDWSISSGYEAARNLPDGSGVTAVLAANDRMALGVIRGLQDRGLHVPADMSVFGWDDEEFTRYFTPAVSTVYVDREAYGRQGMTALLAVLRGEPQPPVTVEDLFRVIPRDSTGAAPR